MIQQHRVYNQKKQTQWYLSILSHIILGGTTEIQCICPTTNVLAGRKARFAAAYYTCQCIGREALQKSFIHITSLTLGGTTEIQCIYPSAGCQIGRSRYVYASMHGEFAAYCPSCSCFQTTGWLPGTI